MLIVALPRPTVSGGNELANNYKYVYCNEPQFALGTSVLLGKRLVRYSITPFDSKLDTTQVNSDLLCDDAHLRTLFPTATSTSKVYLTNDTCNVISIKFWPVWYEKTAQPAGQLYDIEPQAVRIVASAQYIHHLIPSDPLAESRVTADQTLSPQITITSLAKKNRVYTADSSSFSIIVDTPSPSASATGL